MNKHLPNSLRALFLSLAVLLSLPVLAEEVEIDGIKYDLNADARQATVIKKSSGKYSGEVVIPESVEHEGAAYSVTSIGSFAFFYCSDLTSVTIPNSVTSIGQDAFYYCSGLTSVTIPNSVTSIGVGAFSGCSGLTSVTIPNSVTSIGERAFYECSGLTSIIVEDGNPVYDSRNNCNAIIETATNTLHSGCKTTIIPNSVTSIGDYAFFGCSGLTSVTIPNSVTSIGRYAFNGCSGLTSVTIPNSVTSIGGGAFCFCSGLTSIVVEDGNPVYDSRNNCNAIIETATNTLNYGCKTTIIPNNVTSIGEGAFYYCSDLTSVTIPNSVTSIGDYAFGGCSGLTSIVVEDGNPVYDSRNNCNAIIETATNTLIAGCSETVIPNSVTAIEEWAVLSTQDRNDVFTIGNGVKSIGQYAFIGYHNVVCHASVPPVCHPSSFSSVWGQKNLYVPKESVEEYSKVAPWNEWTIHGFTTKKTKDGREMLVVETLPVKSGVYRQTQYKRGDQPVEDYPFEVYNKVFGTDTVVVGDDIKKMLVKAVQMEVYAVHGQNNTMVPCFLITNPQLNVIEAGKKVFTNRWVCDMYSHKTIKHGTIVNEYYTKKFKPSTVYKEIEKVFKTKPSKKNAYLGVWKCKNYNTDTYYKIYGEKYRVGMHIRWNDAQGRIETVEYLKDKSTIEGGNPCDIRWTSPDSYTLSYQWKGNTISEIWERSSMEELGENFNRVVMNKQQK